jgi:micrococcal nuclease
MQRWIGVLIGACLLAAACTPTGSSQAPESLASAPASSTNSEQEPQDAFQDAGFSHQERAQVLRVVDGDTIQVRLTDGRVDRVRYIGIDTPETVAPDRPVEAWGAEATTFNEELLANGTIFLERDITNRDRFDRLLRYVYVAGPGDTQIFVNEALVTAGLASVTTFPPDVRYLDALLAAETEARLAERGIWGPAPGSAGPE